MWLFYCFNTIKECQKARCSPRFLRLIQPDNWKLQLLRGIDIVPKEHTAGIFVSGEPRSVRCSETKISESFLVTLNVRKAVQQLLSRLFSIFIRYTYLMTIQYLGRCWLRLHRQQIQAVDCTYSTSRVSMAGGGMLTSNAGIEVN